MESQTVKSSQNVSIHKKKRTCSNCYCNCTGHGTRNCPLLKAAGGTNPVINPVAHQNRVAGQQHPSPNNQTSTRDYSKLNLERCLYVVFDLEIMAQILDGNGIQVEDGIFSEFCRPSRPVPRLISELTGITDELLNSASPFALVTQSLIKFITSRATEQTVDFNHIVFVAHNNKVFDVSFFLNSLRKHNLIHLLFDNPKFGLAIDTLLVTKKGCESTPEAMPYNLPTLFQYVTCGSPTKSHRGLQDVKSLVRVFRYSKFLQVQNVGIFSFLDTTLVTTALPDDSDFSEDDNQTDRVLDDEEGLNFEQEIERDEPLGDIWEVNVLF